MSSAPEELNFSFYEILLDFPGGSVFDFEFPMQEVRVWSLDGELRTCMVGHGQNKYNKIL